MLRPIHHILRCQALEDIQFQGANVVEGEVKTVHSSVSADTCQPCTNKAAVSALLIGRLRLPRVSVDFIAACEAVQQQDVAPFFSLSFASTPEHPRTRRGRS
jgi:hypothetical protein